MAENHARFRCVVFTTVITALTVASDYLGEINIDFSILLYSVPVDTYDLRIVWSFNTSKIKVL